MKTSELIERLQEAIEIRGDQEIAVLNATSYRSPQLTIDYLVNKGRISHNHDAVAYIKNWSQEEGDLTFILS